MSSDAKREGYVGPNDPAYYAPRELRERSTSEQPGTMPIQTEEWRPRMPTEGPPLQPFGKPPRRQELRNVHQSRCAGHAGGERRGAGRSAIRAPRSVGAARAVPAGHPLFDRGGDCGEHRDASRHGHSVFATPRRPGQRVAFGRLAVGKIVGYPGAAAAATAEAHGDPGRAGRQRLGQRSPAAWNSRRRSAARRVRIHQRTDCRRPADVRQAYRSQRVAGVGDGDFRRFGHSAGRIHRPDAGHGGIA